MLTYPLYFQGGAEHGAGVVGVVMGSDSDYEAMEPCLKYLDQLGVAWEVTVASAHRSPERAEEYARRAKGRGLRVLVAGAGGAAHLAGVLASRTTLPVIGVPLAAAAGLAGLDALLSTVQMPAGVPVATVAIGPAGAGNAAILACQILALAEPRLARRLEEFKHALAAGVVSKAKAVAGRAKQRRDRK